jgi:probable rRNA maturation factor
MSIQFFNADVAYRLAQKTALRSWIESVIKKEGYSLEELTIIFCSDEYLYKMNVEYLKHDTYTDIITFDLSSVKHSINGELYISIDRVKENAKANSVTISNELHRVIIHGTLHLCGYKDKSPQSKKLMTTKEDESLKRLSKYLA